MRVKINDLVFGLSKVIFGRDGSMTISTFTDYKVEDIAETLKNATEIEVTDATSSVIYFNKKLQAYRYEMPNKLEVSYVVSLIADETIADMQTKIDKNTSVVENCAESVAEANAKVENVSSAIVGMQSEIETAQTDISDLNDAVAELGELIVGEE